MLTGYNTDIKHEGVVYHVQTEDSGVDNPVIVSLVYQGGRILASRKTSYAQLLPSEGLIPQLRDLLEKQHREMIKAVLTGSLDGGLKKEPVPGGQGAPVIQPSSGPPASTVYPQPPAETGPATPSAPASATEKNLDQVILEYLASELEND